MGGEEDMGEGGSGADTQQPSIAESTLPGRLRVTLALSRGDDPNLLDALVRLQKGRRRVARLRTLAHDGLTVGQSAPTRSQEAAVSDPTDDGGALGEHEVLGVLESDVTVDIIEPPGTA